MTRRIRKAVTWCRATVRARGDEREFGTRCRLPFGFRCAAHRHPVHVRGFCFGCFWVLTVLATGHTLLGRCPAQRDEWPMIATKWSHFNLEGCEDALVR